MEKTKATKEMQMFYAELTLESNSNYLEKRKLQEAVQKLNDDIGVAVIWFGKAIKIMTDRLTEAKNKLDEENSNMVNIALEFKEKFGVNIESIDFFTQDKK